MAYTLKSLDIIDWYDENITEIVNNETKAEFIALKNGIEGWKKGTQIRGSMFKPVDKNTQIKENLSLYINQISQQNYKTTKNKIKREIEHSKNAQNILIKIVVQTGMLQENNLELLIRLLEELGLIHQIIHELQDTLSKMKFTQINEDSYDQLCIDTKNNTLFKNGYLFLAYIYRDTLELSNNAILSYLNFIEKSLGDDKDINEKYIQLYVSLIAKIDKKLVKECPDVMTSILSKLNCWKNDKATHSNKARFTILDYLETLEN